MLNVMLKFIEGWCLASLDIGLNIGYATLLNLSQLVHVTR